MRIPLAGEAEWLLPEGPQPERRGHVTGIACDPPSAGPWKRGGVALPRDAVDEVLRLLGGRAALHALAEAFDQAAGGEVVRPDEADHAVLVEDGEGVGEGGAGALGGVAVVPEAPRERPGELEVRPALQIGEPDDAGMRAIKLEALAR